MNLAWHHFKKEARHIHLRWWLWIGLMILDLALQLEWLMPMTGFEFGESLPSLAHTGVLGCAIILNLSSCAEDLPSRDGAFVATRPLPWWSYYLARVGVVLLMFVVPLMLQEALYLALSHRPWSALFAGAAWQGAIAVAWLAWTVPSAALWKHWLQALLGIALLIGGMWLSAGMIETAFAGQSWLREVGGATESGSVMTAWVALLFWSLLAWWNRRDEPTIRQKMMAMVALAPMLYAVSMSWTMMVGKQQADSARVDVLAQAARVTIPQEHLRPLLKVSYQDRPATAFYGQMRITGLPPEVEMRSRLKQLRAMQGGKVLPAHLTEDDTRRQFQQIVPDFDPGPIKQALPTGTVLIPPTPEMSIYGGNPLEYELGRVEVSVDRKDKEAAPLSIEWDFEARWFEWRQVADLPLRSGARVITDDAEMVIEKVLPDTAPWYHAKSRQEKGTLTLHARIHQRAGDATLHYILYCPERRLAWYLGDKLTWMAMRAKHTGWARHLGVLSQRAVLNHTDGAAASDLSKLRLVVMQRRELGRSAWTWKTQPMEVRQHVPGYRDWYYEAGSPLFGDTLEVLGKRIDGLPIPGPQAPRVELNRYVLDVLKAFHALKTPHLQNQQYDLVVAKLRPFAQQHVDVLLDLPSSAVAGQTSPVFRLARELTTEAHRDFVVGRIMECDWLAALTTAKGWSEYAREKMLAATLTVPRHERHLRTLMLSWDDASLRRRQVAELKFFPDAAAFEKLYRRPELRPELDQLAQDLWQETPPVITWEIVSRPRLEIAIAQGNAQALDLALHWLARGKVEDQSYNIDQARQLAQNVAKTTGMTPPAGNDRQFFKPFRDLSAAQFEYMPDQRGWRKKP